MKNLHQYLKTQLARIDPRPAIDHRIRAQLHQDGRISFYIHADSRDSETVDFWVSEDGELTERRSVDEPLPDAVRAKVLAATKRFRAQWGVCDNQRLIVRDADTTWQEIEAAIETVDGVSANYLGFNDLEWEFLPRFGKLHKSK